MARFEVRLAHRPNGSELHVWDTTRDLIARNFYGKNAVFFASAKYTWDEASQWASNWADLLNTHGYVAGITVNDQVGRGRPRRDPACPKGTAQYNRTVAPKNTNPVPKLAPITPIHDRIAELEAQSLSTDEDKIAFDPDEVRRILTNAVNDIAGDVSRRLENEIEGKALELTAWLDAVKEEIKRHKNITITTTRGTHTLTGLHHERLPKLFKLINAGVSPMLVGAAGTGKTTAGLKIAESLSLKFYPQSVSAQSTKADLFGFIDVGGTYRGTGFRQAYEHGGLFLLDEVDAGNPNVLVALNAALSGDRAGFPDGVIMRHDDFLCIAAANTFGNGASRQYVGRNQLDAATLDRFTMFTWDVDEVLEASMVEHLTHGKKWHAAIKAARRTAQASNMHVVISPRATQKGASLLDQEFTFEECLDMTILHSADASQRVSLKASATMAWQNYA